MYMCLHMDNPLQIWIVASISMESAEMSSSSSSSSRLKKKRREEEIVETALAAAGASLFVSGIGKILPYVILNLTRYWPKALVSPLLFLLLHVVVASIVIISTQPGLKSFGTHFCSWSSRKKRNRKTMKRRTDHSKRIRKKPVCSSSVSKKVETNIQKEEEVEEEGSGDAEELNARVEAFIAAFRQQLRLQDSFVSGPIHIGK